MEAFGFKNKLNLQTFSISERAKSVQFTHGGSL